MSAPGRPPHLDARIAEIRGGPEGSRVGAFFVLEDLLIVDPAARADRVAERLEPWAGRPEEDLMADGDRRFRKGLAAALSYEAWQLVKAHARRGHTVAVVSAGTPDRVEPVARELGVERVLCTVPEAPGGVLTGRVAGPVLTGAVRAEAIRRLAGDHDIDLADSHAYGAADGDIALLELVGHGCAVNPAEGLERAAGERGWPVLRFREAPSDASPVPILRTVAAYGGFFASTGVGVAAGLLGRRRRTGVDTATNLYGAVGPALAGVDVEVHGEENAWSQRPAVFMPNHQSHLVDALVTFKLLRRDFTVVAKREARDIPALGQALQLADWVFVERVTGDREKAIAAMQPVVDKLREGVSIIIAPEGTRSMGPTVGPFKKGGFHMAMQAGVPVVPIIMRNSGSLMWRNAKTLRSGTVQVVVPPPIPTHDWTPETLDDRIAEVRQIYVDTLEDWPEQPGVRI